MELPEYLKGKNLLQKRNQLKTALLSKKESSSRGVKREGSIGLSQDFAYF
jgi:hypothetical protein